MNCFAALPKHVLHDMLTSWLLLVDVGRVDSALCVRSSRRIFSELLSVGTWRCDWNRNNFANSESFVSWIVKRSVPLTNFNVGEKLHQNSSLRVSLFDKLENSLSSIDVPKHRNKLHDDTDNILIDLSLACSQLQECTVGHTDCKYALFALLARNPNLRKLSICGDDWHLHKIVRLVPSLIDLTLDGLVYEEDMNMVLRFCSPKMVRLCLTQCQCTDSWLVDVLRQCPMLRELQIGGLPLYWSVPTADVLIAAPSTSLLKFHCHVSQFLESEFAFLARIMPQLHTLVVLEARDLGLGISQQQLEATLNSFVHLRQLVTNADCVHMLAGSTTS